MSRRRSLLNRKGFWLGLAGAAALSAGAAYYVYHRNVIDYYLRLARVQWRANRFYNSYPLISKNVAYCETQSLDVYQPEASGSLRPVMLYIYGGSWVSGQKELYAPAAQLLLPHNIVVVVPTYTLHPKANWRQQVREVADSIAWTLENAERFGGDPRRVVLAGQSAGAHLAALAMLDESWLKERGHHWSELAGFLGISGVYDLTEQLAHEYRRGHEGALLLDHFEGSQNLALASPLAYVQAGLPPVRLIHGDADQTVPIAISDTFQAALAVAGNSVDYSVYPGGKHAEILFDALTENPSRLIRDMSAFTLGVALVHIGG